MTFPDQSHINRVRDALHQRAGNGASVMVGSGFSKNADRINLNAKEMPGWQDLVNHFHSALYPQDSTPCRGNNLRPATDNVRIAQEYEAAFGRSALHDALRRLVPHAEYSPGVKHRRLLQLPWRDIYTTNWDTLLERAQGQVPERNYSAVTSMGEIPMASRPRIVKLHGSFPAQFPLIVTEEDYRTYPTKFAPFVNTVQQSMMETVFLLIGFSGDDPNFLNWSGWVRDNLGGSAPKIYLAGWLGLSPHRRRMLEHSNVVPIDLAQHPKSGQWPDILRHQYATEWLLRTLELERPYNITSWPTPSRRQKDETLEILQPIEEATPEEPTAEPTKQDIGAKPSPAPDEVREITAIWRHNRLIYPEWLTMPFSNRGEFQRNTEAWNRTIIASLQDLHVVERLSAIRELVWREGILLVPMYSDLESAIHEILNLIDCHNRTINGVAGSNEDWTAIREDWRNVAAALVTATRFGFDRAAFEKATEALNGFQDEDHDIRHHIYHEKCLWAIYDRDFNSLDDLLANWKTENCDPAWMMRKSAVLWEAGRNSEAEELLNNSIALIKAMPVNENSLANLSRESWATFIALDWDNRLISLDRIMELVPMRCDVFGERQSVTEGMGKDKAEEDPPPFDINRRRGTSERWTNYNPSAAAYRAVRLSEMAGLPPFTSHSTVWAEVLKKAADEVADYDLEFAIRLVLRACNGDSDKTLERILTRIRIATMPTELAESLTEFCLNALDKAMRDKVTQASATQQRFNTAAEVLSRLAIRLELDQAESILNKAVEYCRNDELAKSFVGGTIRNLLMRSWEALPDERRQHRAMDLLGTEIVGLSSIEPIMGHNWPDPGEVVALSETKLIRTPDNEPQWQGTIDLIARALTGNARARRRASIRMIPIVDSDLLTEEESLKIANALWTELYTESNGLPSSVAMPDCQFLSLPEPTPGLAQERFRSKWMFSNTDLTYDIQRNAHGFQIYGNSSNGLNHDPRDVESRLWQTGQAIRILRKRGEELTLSSAEKAHLESLVKYWIEDPMPQSGQWEIFQTLADLTKQRIQDMTAALPPVIEEINVPSALGEKLYAKMQQLTEKQIPALSLSAALVKLIPERSEDIAIALRVGMTSDDDELAANAVSGVYLWLKAVLDSESQVPQPPNDLVREVGIAIASRRSTVIVPALQVAKWIFHEGQASHKESIRQLVEDGLTYLAQELRYDRKHENPDEVPRKRLYCVELAAEMARDSLNESPPVTRWLEMAREDPLPEVREAVATRRPQ
jgi:hypothetical protein